MKEESLTPLYLQAARMVMDQIKSHTFREGEVLPRMNQLSRVFHMNASAMERGLQYLVDQKILSRKNAIEYVVEKGAIHILMEESRRQFFEERVPSFLKEGMDLGISKDEILQFLSENFTEEDVVT